MYSHRAVPLDIANLRAVAMAARLGSFTRAADVLNISQPALSRRIAEVEGELGVQLFARQPRGVRATDACLAFLPHAEIVLNSIESGREAALDADARRLVSVDFGFLENLCDDLLTDACQRTLAGVEAAAINFRPRVLSSELTSDLLSGAIRLGLRYGRDTEPQVDSMWLADDPIVVACPASHPLAKRGKVTLADLAGAQWIGAVANVQEPAIASEEGLPAAIYSGWTAMKMVPIFARLKLLEAGFGLALVRRACLRERGPIVELETPMRLSLPIFLAWRRGIHFGRAEERLREELRLTYQALSARP
jgi:DNA-binding transcriptional LysR family regulator